MGNIVDKTKLAVISITDKVGHLTTQSNKKSGNIPLTYRNVYAYRIQSRYNILTKILTAIIDKIHSIAP